MLTTATFEFNKAMATLEHLFDGEGYVAGEEFTMADVMLAHTLTWAESFKFDVPEKFLTYRNKMYYRKGCKNAVKVVEEK
jgi:glutathione S-transferase